LGPERLARSAREIGKFVKNVKSYMTSLSSELQAELQVLDEIDKVKKDLMK
jgi:Sec-independent protein translocase protein TatA